VCVLFSRSHSAILSCIARAVKEADGYAAHSNQNKSFVIALPSSLTVGVTPKVVVRP
jgi:hypothetical protein